MLNVFKNYLSHSTIYGFFIMALVGMYYIVSNGLLFDYLFWFFIPIILAPFYEWYVHKYQLHRELTKKEGWYRRYQIIPVSYTHLRAHETLRYLQGANWSLILSGSLWCPWCNIIWYLLYQPSFFVSSLCSWYLWTYHS